MSQEQEPKAPPPEAELFDEDSIPAQLFYRIGEVAALVGVETHVLRYWEGEFRIRPQRSDNGQRMYRRKDIARFLHIKRLLYQQGYTLEGAKRVLFGTPAPGAGSPPAEADAARQAAAVAQIELLRARLAEVRRRFSQGG